jgi:hypothetical protein
MEIAEIVQANDFFSPRRNFFQDRVDDGNEDENDAHGDQHLQKGEGASGSGHGRKCEKLGFIDYLQSKLRTHFERGV